jgi:F-type H+-transporting ATPase subunit alpha
VEDIRRFETDLLDYLRRGHGGVLTTIRETRELSDDTVTALKDAVEAFRGGFETGDGELLVKDESVEALESEDQEKIARRVPKATERSVS